MDGLTDDDTSEVSQAGKDEYHVVSLLCGI